jgi:iron(III) transport system ATP-binding protein
MKNAAKNLELIDLSKTFITSTRGEVKAVQKVNIKIEQGEFVTLLGPSGCGKTTLLRMIAGFELPTSGQILIGGNDVSSKTPDKRDIGMVFQNYALFPHLNVFNNIAYGLKLQKLPKDEIEERVNQALKAVQMDDFAVRVPSQMSGGQQQRVALARALVMEPTVLLFDEPLSNLDAKLRIHMRDEIRRIQRDVGITTVYVTHDQSEAMAMSDKIVILKDGLVQQIDSPQRIYQRPNNVFISNFIGKANIIGGTIISCENNRAEIDIEGITFSVPEKIEYKAGTKVEIVIRPESVLVGKKGFTAKVTKSVYMGSTQDYRVEFDSHKIEISDNNPTSKRVYAEGENMEFSLDSDSIHIL